MATTFGIKSQADENDNLRTDDAEKGDETGGCCDCCEGSSCSTCCQKCRRCSCCGGARAQAPPTVFNWSDGIRDVIDKNEILGCVFRFRPSPSCSARWLLMILFLMAAVFNTYALRATGPICVREYLSQCPPFQTLAQYIPPKHLTQAPPAIDVPEAVTLLSSPSKTSNGTFGSDAGSVMTVEAGKSYPEVARDSMLKGWAYMFGSFSFNCYKPMCDIFYPQQIDWLSLWRLTNSLWGSSKSYNIPATSEAVILGYCKCEGDGYQGIVSASVTNEARSQAVTLIFQTLIVAIFRTVLTRMSDDTEQGPTSRCKTVCKGVTVVLLLGTIVTMAATVFLIEFDPAGWRNAFLLTAVNAAIVSPLLAVGQMLLCDKAGWPLRRCGFGPPEAPPLRAPMLCGVWRDKTPENSAHE